MYFDNKIAQKNIKGSDKKHSELYYNVLESKNKNFGEILASSESQSEIGIPTVNAIEI